MEYQNPSLARVQKKPLQSLKQRLHYFGKGDILYEKTLRFRYHFFVCLFMSYSIIIFFSNLDILATVVIAFPLLSDI